MPKRIARGLLATVSLAAPLCLGASLALAMSPAQEAAIDLLRKESPPLAADIQSGLDRIDRSNASEDEKARQRARFLDQKLNEVSTAIGERNTTFRLIRDMKQQDDGTKPEDRSIIVFDELKGQLDAQVEVNRREQAFVNVIKRGNARLGNELETEFRRIESDPKLTPEQVQQAKRDWLIKKEDQLTKAADAAQKAGNNRAAEGMRQAVLALGGLRAVTWGDFDPQKVVGVENADLGADLYRAYLLEFQKLGGKVTVPIPAQPPVRQSQGPDLPEIEGKLRLQRNFGDARAPGRATAPPAGSGALPGSPSTDACSASYAGDFGAASGFQSNCWHVSLALTSSSIATDALFGTGTVVNGGEHFVAEAPSRINRFGFDIDGKYQLPGGGVILGEKAYIIGGFSYAGGSASDFGRATVGEDGVTKIGLTYLYEEPGNPPSTGIGTDPDNPAFNGYFIEGAAEVRNSWGALSFGYAEAFRPGGPGTSRWQVGVEGLIEWLNLDYTASSDIYSPLDTDTPVVFQDTEGESRTTWVGARISGAWSYPLTDKLSIGLNAKLTPAYRVSKASLWQYTSTGIEQRLEEEFRGMVVGGTAGASLRYEFNDNLNFRLSYEHSCLPGVAEVNVPENPDEQPAFIESATVTRDMFKAAVNFKF